MLSNIKVGLNGWGTMVLFCEPCQETFETKGTGIQGNSVEEVVVKAARHECNPANLEFVAQLKKSSTH